MPQFTQLNLQAKPQEKSGRSVSAASPAQPAKKCSAKKTTAIGASLVVTALVGVILLESIGCSKGSDKTAVAIASPAPFVHPESTLPSSAPEPAAATQPAATKKPAPKKRQHTLSASTYTNPTYGLSFRYPKSYSLKENEQASQEWGSLAPMQMNFVQAGGTAISAVELPAKMYRGTDLSAAFFNVSVNSRLTAEQCEQFAAPSQTDSGKNNAATAVEPSKVKLGAAEYTEVENSAGDTKKADAKYYHVFQNGACYEFALGLETAGDGSNAATKPIDRNEVFRKLNWMLSTVKIEAAKLPEAAPVTATTTASPATTNVTPGQKD